MFWRVKRREPGGDIENLEKMEEDEGSAAATEAAAEAEDEYRVWKKNTPFLYDLVISHALEWPSLTVQWLPAPSSSSSSQAPIHGLLLGTHTSDDAPNFLMLSSVRFPLRSAPATADSAPIPSIEIYQSVRHDGEVNRARFMPQKPDIVATKTCGSDVHVFDCGRRRLGSPSDGEDCAPDVLLRGHSTEGYGISWNPMKEGRLLSGSYDSKICLWDVGEISRVKSLDAYQVFEVIPQRVF